MMPSVKFLLRILLGCFFNPLVHGSSLGIYPSSTFLDKKMEAKSNQIHLQPTGGKIPMLETREKKLGQVLPELPGFGMDEETALVGKRHSDQVLKPGQKRDTALLLDKIMYALKKAMDQGEGLSSPAGHQVLKNNLLPANENHLSGITPNDLVAYEGNGLERRGNSHGKVYWRCYFNAVSCF